MEATTAAEQFNALAQPTRIDAVRTLAAQGPTGLTAGDLAAALGQAPSTLSFHLAALQRAGLITSVRRGRTIVYSVRLAGLRSLLEFLTETCCGGRPDLCAQLRQAFPDDAAEAPGLRPAVNVLFLCTHNSARSIIAEAVLNAIGAGRFNAYSAGAAPAARVMPEVIDLLGSFGRSGALLRSKSWDEFTGAAAPRMDVVVTLCDVLDGRVCPEFGSRVITTAWPFPDPAKFTGSNVERATYVRALYGMIRRRLELFVNLPYATLDRAALTRRLDELGDIARYA